MTQTKKKTDNDLWTEPWRGSWATRPLAWCALAWCAGALAWKLQVPLLWLILAAIGATIVAPVIATALDEPLRGRWFHTVLWAAVGAYVIWLAADTPLQRDAFIAWIPGAGILGTWWWGVRHLNATERRLGLDVLAKCRQQSERGMWVDMLERVLKKPEGKSGLHEISRTPFPAGASYGSTLRLGLPRDGSITYPRLEGLVEELVTAANVRTGSLLFERDLERGAEVLLHVMERDALIETIPLPFDRGPKSIHQPIELGRYADGQVALLTFREIAVMLVGLKGSGKSSLINTGLAHLTGCEDAVVWMIDLKAGETVTPWMLPFLEGTTGRCAIDWVATTEDEAEAMLTALNAAIRGARGRGKGVRGKVKPTRDKPSIILVVEEASLVTGVGKYQNTKRAGLLQDAVNTGRSSACDALVCSQRATVTMLGNGDMVSNLDVRIGMGVTDRQEASMVMPSGAWSAVLARIPVDKPHRGSFLMQDDNEPRLMPAKAYWVDEDLIPGMAVTNSGYRPDVDAETVELIEAALSLAGVSGGYAGRWDRLRETLGYASHAPSQTASQAPSQEPSQGGGAETSQESRGARLVQEAIDAGRAERERLKFDAIVSANFAETGDDETPLETVPVQLPETVPPVLRLMLAAFKARGNPDDLPTRILCEDLPGDLNPTALGRLMGHCNVSPGENIVWEGKRARGYTRDAVETAIKRGSFNAQAFDWRP